MRMLVLAGGFGTRLQSVIAQVPKALAPVHGVPFLYLQIENWISQGLRSFVFLLHHQADQIISFLNEEANRLLRGCEVVWLIEPIPMGTGGAVAYAVSELGISGNFLLTNADTWLGMGLKELSVSSAPSLAVVRSSDTHRYGQVQLDSNSCVVAFTEKEGATQAGWINAGLCNLNVDLFRNWNGQPFSLEKVSLPQFVRQGLLKAVILQTDFIDIGVPDDYLRFCHWIKSNRRGKLCS